MLALIHRLSAYRQSDEYELNRIMVICEDLVKDTMQRMPVCRMLEYVSISLRLGEFPLILLIWHCSPEVISTIVAVTKSHQLGFSWEKLYCCIQLKFMLFFYYSTQNMKK